MMHYLVNSKPVYVDLSGLYDLLRLLLLLLLLLYVSVVTIINLLRVKQFID